MKKSLIVNGTEYGLREMTFADVVNMEDMGVSIISDGKSILKIATAIFAIIAEEDYEWALTELSMASKKEGFIEILNSLSECLTESDFFTQMVKQNQK